ncbi:hypothetical protein UlMin_032867 [Ulmus minor]
MIVLAWNCRGMGQPSAIRELRALVRSSNPDCMLLMEAKVNSGTMASILHNLHFLNHVYVPPVGLSGGFCVAWRDGIEMEPVTMNKHIISCLVFSSPGSAPWLFSAVYGPNSSMEKRLFWDNIHLQTKCFSGAWLIMGDFNTIWSSSDRSSGSGMDIGSRRMRSALDNLGMILIPASGGNYTWSNHRQGHRRIRSKIDRVVANDEWWSCFPNASIRMLPQTTSDHNPQILYCFGQNSFAKRPFRFEAMWTEDKRSYWVVNQAWQSFNHQFPPSRFFKRLSACRQALWHWNKSQFGNLQSNISTTREAIAKNQLCSQFSDEVASRDSNLRSHLEYLLKLEEMFWLQKSRLKWQTDGDRCTRFFFLYTLTRRKNNRIECIKDDSGIWLSSREEIGNTFLAKLHATYDEDSSPINIHNTIFRMGSFKAAGPDGMPALFFKAYWSTVGDDVVAMVRNFFLTGYLHPLINQSNIILIPKGQNVSTTNQFRPIAVCNVIYKVISKILANRVMPLLNKLICPTQNTFVPGRSIHDNSVLIQEVLHAMKKKRGGQAWMAMKIDLQKAYDRLSWNFLKYVLTAFGFHPTWIRWVLLCCSTTSMTLMLNGAAFQSFRPKRGLRQGDPISPYMLILCMEVLSRLINQKVSSGLVAGFKLDRHTPALHHLFFADDIFLMGKCTVNEAFYFKDCLDTFCSWSGQSFNPRKSNIFFSSKASRQSSGLIATLMGFDKIPTSSAYLGLPLLRSGRSKDFNFLVEKLDSKLDGWKSRVLSKAKRLVLIKSIALALPVYTMQSMKLSNSICSKLDAIIRNFWWSASKSTKPLCLKAWAEVSQPKQWGGLGFRRMKDLNLSLLAKWAWKLVQGQNSLCCSILNARYLLHTKFLQASQSRGDSPFWKAVMATKDIIRSGSCYLVGNNESIDIWEDPWVPSFPGFRPPPKGEPRLGWMSVKDLILQPGMWDRSKLQELFDPHIVNLISAMHLPVRDKRDTMIWTPVSNGTFSAKSAYLSTNATRFKDITGILKVEWNKLWNCKTILPRHKVLWWQILTDCLPLRSHLASRFSIPDITCPICHSNVENSLHLFVFCDLARKVWFASPRNLRMDSLELASPMHFLRFLWDVESKDSRMAVGFMERKIMLFASVLCDLLWKHRNDITHGGSPMDPNFLFRNINRSYQSLLKNLSPPAPAAPISWSPPPPSDWVGES